MKETTSCKPIYSPNVVCCDVQDLPERPLVKTLFLTLNYSFKNPMLFIEAMTHSSAVHESPQHAIQSYERLEFLGDAILEALVSTKIYQSYPDLSEGQLSKLRGALVNQNSFAELGEMLELGKIMVLGKGEIKARGYEKKGLLADCFEALMGAVFLDSDYSRTEKLFSHILDFYREKHGREFVDLSRLDSFDAKSRLQELTMKLFKVIPYYKNILLKGGSYEVELFINNQSYGSFESASKKEAERKLAKKVLKQLEEVSC